MNNKNCQFLQKANRQPYSLEPDVREQNITTMGSGHSAPPPSLHSCCGVLGPKQKKYCAPGAEPRHEIFFYFFRVVFVKGALPSWHQQNALEVLLLFHRAHFVDKLGTHSESIANSTETAVKLKKNVA